MDKVRSLMSGMPKKEQNRLGLPQTHNKEYIMQKKKHSLYEVNDALWDLH